MPISSRNLVFCLVCSGLLSGSAARAADFVRDLQTAAITEGKAPLGHWGPDPANYTAWGSHSNRLIPVYTFGTKGAGQGVDLDDYSGRNSVYRNEAAIRRIFGS